MSSIVLLLLAAGSVFAVFLLAASLMWSIRMRGSEENFIPAPEELKYRRRGASDSSAGSETNSEWLQEREHGSASITAEGMQAENREASVSESERVSIGVEPESPLKDFLRNAIPQLSNLGDLAKLVRQIQAVAEKIDTSEERRAAIMKAAEQLMEQQPDNEFLRELLDSLQVYGYSAAETEPPEGVQVVQTAGRNLIHVDGVEYYSVEEIPDPEKREQARRLLASFRGEKQE